MTEARIATLFTSLAAYRQAEATRAGEIAVVAGQVRDAGLDDLAAELDRHANAMAEGLAVLTRIADEAQDETQTMSLDDIA